MTKVRCYEALETKAFTWCQNKHALLKREEQHGTFSNVCKNRPRDSKTLKLFNGLNFPDVRPIRIEEFFCIFTLKNIDNSNKHIPACLT